MLTKIDHLPEYVLGVRAAGKVDKKDLEDVLLPGLKSLSEKNGEIYYLLVLETQCKILPQGPGGMTWSQGLNT